MRARGAVAPPSTERSALAFARLAHAGQRRSADGAPFILHPIEVASLLRAAGAPEHVIAAGLLHDTLEKTDTDIAELRRRFGPRVTALVQALTEDGRITKYRDRKAALREQVAGAGDDALIVFAADKVSKLREIGLVPPVAAPAEPRPSMRGRRMVHYRRCLELLESLVPSSSLVGLLRTELERVLAVR
jgi:(p)ppGpp synthase/HD superfamily hydrolase